MQENWTQLVGGMPQGSWLGPLIFLLLIDDLQLDCMPSSQVCRWHYFIAAHGQWGP